VREAKINMGWVRDWLRHHPARGALFADEAHGRRGFLSHPRRFARGASSPAASLARAPGERLLRLLPSRTRRDSPRSCRPRSSS
jgi:hypothetical protein